MTPLGGQPVDTQVIWQGIDDVTLRIRSSILSGSGDISDIRPRLHIRRDHVPALPQGSTITAAPMEGAVIQAWRVDEVIDTDPEVLVAVVH